MYLTWGHKLERYLYNGVIRALSHETRNDLRSINGLANMNTIVYYV